MSIATSPLIIYAVVYVKKISVIGNEVSKSNVGRSYKQALQYLFSKTKSHDVMSEIQFGT